jgi:tRNA G10  N-methylase Trm11
VPKLFFLLSGENKSLPAAEVKAILDAEGYPYSNSQEFDQILRLEAELESVKVVQIRSAYTRVCAQELLLSNATYSNISEAAAKTDFKAVLKPGESFVVRINRIKN